MKTGNNNIARPENTDEASQWVARLHADYCTEEDRAAFRRWLELDPAHQAEFDSHMRLWKGVELLGDIPLELETTAPCSDQPPSFSGEVSRKENWIDRLASYFTVWSGGAALLSLITAVLLVTLHGQDPVSYYATQAGQQSEILLDDGSQVFLNTNSKLEVEYTEHQRSIKLLHGEAFFSVAKAPNRPFIVKAGSGSVRAIGTQFNVWKRTDRVDVSVKEGRIAVKAIDKRGSNSQKAKQETLEAGQRISYKSNGILSGIEDVNSDAVAAWQQNKMVFDNQRLEDVISNAQRYIKGEIVIMDPSLSDIRVTGEFDTTDIPSMLATLEIALPVKVVTHDNQKVLLFAKALDSER